jgi:hypothetical protein
MEPKGRRRKVVERDQKRREEFDVALPGEGAMAGIKRDLRFTIKATAPRGVLSHSESIQNSMITTSKGHVGSYECLQNTMTGA